MKRITMIASALATACMVAAILPATAKMKMDPAVAKKALSNATASGEELFAHGTFGSHRRMMGAPVTCQTCHVAGGRVPGTLPNGKKVPSLVNAAAIFPHYNPKVHQVVTLETQIRKCVQGGIGGKPPAYDSKAMTDMVVYLHSIAKGQPIDMGGKPK